MKNSAILSNRAYRDEFDAVGVGEDGEFVAGFEMQGGPRLFRHLNVEGFRQGDGAHERLNRKGLHVRSQRDLGGGADGFKEEAGGLPFGDMAADYTRVQRLLQIVTLVQSGKAGLNAKELAKATEATERSIYRDLDVLWNAGVPIEFDRKRKGYAMGESFFMPPVSLAFEEALALIAMAEQVGGKAQVPHLKAGAMAAQKLRSQLAPGIRDQLSKTTEHVAIKLAPTSENDNEGDFEKVHRAIEQRRELEVDYVSAKGTGDKPFRLKPYALFFNLRAWYVIGFSTRHNEVRSFKLSRFTVLKPTIVSYEIPKTWSLEKHLGNAWRMIRGNRTYDVELVFTGDFAETIEETKWHRTQKTELLENGDLRFTVTVDGLDEIVWWILSMGPSVKVVKPEELAGRVKKLAEEIVAIYR